MVLPEEFNFKNYNYSQARQRYAWADYKIGASTSAFGLDWGVEFTTTGGYAAPGEDKDTTAGGDHVVGYVSASF